MNGFQFWYFWKTAVLHEALATLNGNCILKIIIVTFIFKFHVGNEIKIYHKNVVESLNVVKFHVGNEIKYIIKMWFNP